MIELLAGTAAGGITGLIGSLAGKLFGFFERKQKLQEKKLEFEQELRLLELEHTLNRRSGNMNRKSSSSKTPPTSGWLHTLMTRTRATLINGLSTCFVLSVLLLLLAWYCSHTLCLALKHYIWPRRQ